MTIKDTQKLSTDRKVEVLMRYIFGDVYAEKEENFWNILEKGEIDEITVAQKEDTVSFEEIKKIA